MKFFSPSIVNQRRIFARAMTIPELMIAMSIFSIAVLGLVSLHIFGLQQDQIVQSKLGASDQSRRAFGQLISDIRGAKIIRVGTGNASTFTPIDYDEKQRGTALNINLTTATNSYIRYFYNTNAGELRRIETGISGYKVIADCLTNDMFFQAEDYQGNVLYDGSHNYVIRTVLRFYQYQYPLTKVGPGYLYDFYKLEFKCTRRAAD
jgi:prepilin-type N-terminal cleavage/methylation domain-containing protein